MTQLFGFVPVGSGGSFAERLPLLLLSAARCLTVLVPLAVVTGNAQADIAATLVGLCFLVDAVLRRDFAWLREPWVAVALALYAVGCARSALALDGWHSLGFAASWLRFLLFAIALERWVLSDPQWRDRLLYGLIAALALFAADALLQYALGADVFGRPIQANRLTGPMGRPKVGILLAWLFLPAAMGLLARAGASAATAFGGLVLVAIVLSGDRMASLFAGAVLVIGLPLAIGRVRVALAALGLAVALVGATLYLAPQTFDRQVRSTAELAESPLHSHYGAIWSRALAMAAANPVFGVGIHDYRVACPDPQYGANLEFRQPDGSLVPRCSTHPHNVYLEWLVELGAVGLLGFVLLALLLATRLTGTLQIAPADPLGTALVVTALARLWPFQSATSFFVAWSAVPLWLVIGWALSYRRVAEVRDG